MVISRPSPAADEPPHYPTLSWQDIEAGKVADDTVGWVWLVPPEPVGLMGGRDPGLRLRRFRKVELHVTKGLVMEPTGTPCAHLTISPEPGRGLMMMQGTMYAALVRYRHNVVHGLVVRGGGSPGTEMAATGPQVGDVLLRVEEGDFETWGQIEDLETAFRRRSAGLAGKGKIAGVVRRAGVSKPVQWDNPSGDPMLGLRVEEVPEHALLTRFATKVGYQRPGHRGSLDDAVADHVPAHQCHSDDRGHVVAGSVEFSSEEDGKSAPAKAGGFRKVRITFTLRNVSDRRILLLGLSAKIAAADWEGEIELTCLGRQQIPLALYMRPGAELRTGEAVLDAWRVPPGVHAHGEILSVEYCEPEGEFKSILEAYSSLKPQVRVDSLKKKGEPTRLQVLNNEKLPLGLVVSVAGRGNAGERVPGALRLPVGEAVLVADQSWVKMSSIGNPEDLDVEGLFVPSAAQIQPLDTTAIWPYVTFKKVGEGFVGGYAPLVLK